MATVGVKGLTTLQTLQISLHIQCESKETIFSNGWEFLIIFTHLLYSPFYTRLQIFTQLYTTLTELCHNKRDHPVNFYISLER